MDKPGVSVYKKKRQRPNQTVSYPDIGQSSLSLSLFLPTFSLKNRRPALMSRAPTGTSGLSLRPFITPGLSLDQFSSRNLKMDSNTCSLFFHPKKKKHDVIRFRPPECSCGNTRDLRQKTNAALEQHTTSSRYNRERGSPYAEHPATACQKADAAVCLRRTDSGVCL